MAGAGFIDHHKRYRGSASLTTQRPPALSTLTVVDVVGAEKELAEFLTRLDHTPLVVQNLTTGGTLLSFRWASGYQNGPGIRLQGVLELA